MFILVVGLVVGLASALAGALAGCMHHGRDECAANSVRGLIAA